MTEILLRDPRLLIVNKPAGVNVHRSRAGGASIEDRFPAWRRGDAGPWLAHRLDRDTAGCLVVCLKKSALIAAQSMFASGRVAKTYWALVAGHPAASGGRIALGLRKIATGNGWKIAPDPAAPPAITDWRVRGTGPGYAWLELTPRTGRTHQLRVHCALLGHPVLGDAVYGTGGEALCLLARAISLPLAPPAAATAPPPSHMEGRLRQCGWSDDDG